MMDHGAADSNDDLVANLQRAGVITSDAVAAALRACPRDAFVPPAHAEEALMDVPVRVEDLGFNISAPHMHCSMLEGLEIAPGDAVLDVGSGCGLITAAAACLTGKQGRVVGIDVRRECCEMGAATVARLRDQNATFAAAAGPVSFETLNAFLLGGTKHVGQYDRVHVGACCPPDHLRPLIDLLKPGGGVVVVPVAPSDLRLIRKDPNGRLTQRVLSQVRFSELEVPGDAEVVLAALRAERRARVAPPPTPSTFDSDVAAVLGALRWKACAAAPLGTSPAGVVGGLPPSPAPEGCPAALAAALGDPDAALVCPGPEGWSLPAHSALLCQRCDLLRARCNSGMADAEAATIAVPEHFSQAAVGCLLRYLYTDALDCGVDAAPEVLAAAQYFGVPRAVALAEAVLARALRAAQRSPRAAEAAADAAAAALALADDHSLSHLKAVALDFAVAHYDTVAATEGWTALGKDQVAAVAAEAARQVALAKHLLKTVQEGAWDGDISAMGDDE